MTHPPPSVQPPAILAAPGASVPARSFPVGSGARVVCPELVGVEVSLATGPLEDLERTAAALPPERITEFFGSNPSLLEVVALRTCHRVELSAWTPSPEASLAALGNLVPPGTASRVRSGSEAVHHLYRVTAGLESIAVGEREVRDQVRAAAGRVLGRGPRPVLRSLLLGAVEAAERIVPSVPASRSIAALAAVKVLEESPVPFPRILITGTGVVGREVAELLSPSGRLTMLYRTRPPDEAFLRSTGARAAPWPALAEELRLADVAVLAAKSGERVLGPGALAGRTRALLVVDLGMPRNADPTLAADPHLRIVDLDGLRPPVRSGGGTAIETEVRRAAEAAATTLRGHSLEAWVDAFRGAVEARRLEILRSSEPFLGPLTAEQRAAVDRLTLRLVSQLTRGPTQGLRALPPGAAGDELRAWILAWLSPSDRRT